jgi:choline transporter-like protein 2/4/5
MAKDDSPIESNRKCRDVLFCLAFFGFWVGMIAVGSVAFAEGDPALLMYGIDRSGNLCGSKKASNGTTPHDFADEPNLLYYDVTEWSTAIAGLSSICVNECPTKTVFTEGWTGGDAYKCVYYKESSVYGMLDGVDDYATDYFDKLNDDVLDTDVYAKYITSMAYQGPCYAMLVTTYSFLNRCVPSLTNEQIDMIASSGDLLANTGIAPDELTEAVQAFDSGRDYLQEYMSDITKGWLIILVCGVICACGLSMVWMVFLRYMAGCMAWCTVLIVNLMFIAATLLCASKAGLVGDDETSGLDEGDVETSTSNNDSSYFEAATYVLAVFTAVLLLFTLIMIPRIRIAVACMKVASQAVGVMPSILLFPFATYAMLLALVAWWVIVTAFLYSTGDIEENTLGTGYTVSWNETIQYMGVYHLFGLLWTNQFIVGFGYCVIAGAIANFYWCKGDKSKIPLAPVLSSAKRTVRYHVGSIALGAFIVAVIQMVRIILEYIDRKTKDLQAGNPILKYAMCLVKYCMWYLEKVMKFINRNAYILVAVKGSSYCWSAIRAVKLIINNALRLAAVNTVGDALIFLGKLCVTLGCAVIAFLMSDLDMYTDSSEDTYLSSPLLPILFSTFVAYAIATVFFQVYEMAVDTVLLSFCEDCEQNGGKPKYAPKLLLDAIGQAPAGASNKVAAK